jgi:hypothetical protein
MPDVARPELRFDGATGHLMRKVTIIILMLVALPSLALANPSPIAGRYGSFIGLFVEAVLIAVILGSKGFNLIRFFYSWGVVTVATFMILIGCFWLFDHLASPMALFSYGFLLLIVAETGIVWIEAIALQRMTRIKFFQRREVAPLRFGQALGYSLLVNVVSFLFGL